LKADKLASMAKVGIITPPLADGHFATCCREDKENLLACDAGAAHQLRPPRLLATSTFYLRSNPFQQTGNARTMSAFRTASCLPTSRAAARIW
jgi:hypothetical protein